MYQCLSGICILHKNYFIHRDIKPSNLFLTDNKKIKIGDFINSVKRKKEGNSHSMQKETKMVGTPLYMAPESYSHQPYGSKADIYSLGCTFYEMCFFNNPRAPISGLNQSGKMIIDFIDIPPKFNQGLYSQDFLNLIFSMLEKNPIKRPDTNIVFDKVKSKYNSLIIQNSSIYCIYRCLLSISSFYDKIKKKSLSQSELIKKPITYTFDLALNHIMGVDIVAFPTINQIRDILTYNNPSFPNPGEIDCLDLIEYIINSLFVENNSNECCKSPFIFTEENDECTLNRENILKKYLLNFNNFFKSFVSNYFYGTFVFVRRCTQCDRIRTFFENFFYLVLNIDSAIKNGYNPLDQNFIYHCFQSSKINIKKFCPNCNTITIQEETKKIFSTAKYIIIYIKYGEEKLVFNIVYLLAFDLKIINTDTYYLKGVIQQNIQNNQKAYVCSFLYSQNWYWEWL